MATVDMEILPERPAGQVNPIAPGEAPPASQQLTVPQSKPLSTFVADEDAEGEFDAQDRQNPMLVIVAKTGELSNLHTPGDMLINKEFVIGGSKAPVELIALAIKKRYQNDLDFDGGEMGDTVDRAIDVTDRGGVLAYRPFDDKASTHFWKPILQVLFLVKKPADLPPSASAFFPFQMDGADWGRVGYTARTKTAYNGIAKTLIMAKQDTGSVRRSLYRLSTKGESWQGPQGLRSWIQPMLRAAGPTSEAMLEFIGTSLKP